MSDFFSIASGSQKNNHRVCRVAYTLNNDQPVACTIIGDQPLFYMDYNGSYDLEEFEDDFFDYEAMGLLEHELNVLKDSIAAHKRMSSEEFDSMEEKYEAFASAASSICQPESSLLPTKSENIVSILQKSRTANAYLEELQTFKGNIILCAQEKEASYDRVSGNILIAESLSLSDQILLSCRELRRHWLHRHGTLVKPSVFHPDDAVLINRLQQADLTINMIRQAWELQLADEKAPWVRLETSSLEDLARSYAREAFSDFRNINNGHAAIYTLESWFLSERCRQVDKELIYDMLAENNEELDLYEVSKSLTPDLIAGLGHVPFGKNYLAEFVTTIMNDPIFNDVRDRANANFLWFIKFERSYQETEQGLQLNPNQMGHGSLHDSSNKIKEGHGYETMQAGELVTLYSADDIQKSTQSSIHNDGRSADIIYFQRRFFDG